MNSDLLIIFVKNPVAGKVKTRLAKDIGGQNALHIYKTLLKRTRAVAEPADADCQVWYSEWIDRTDSWPDERFDKFLQKGKTLGDRMSHAIRLGFDSGYKRVVIIGSDCADLRTEDINSAFRELQKSDAVMGPAEDGGYYLLGLSRYIGELFSDKSWSQESLYEQTMETFRKHNSSVKELRMLNDIDTIDDLRRSGIIPEPLDE